MEKSNNPGILKPDDISTIYQQDKAAIDIQIATAKSYPRNITNCMNNAVAIVTMDRETASTCTYSIPRAGKQITGPSVHLARILAKQWGNMRIEAKVINISRTHVTSQAIAFDLENNLAIRVEVKRSIVGKYGRFNEDMITVTGNAANAIALRNAVFAVIPKSVISKVYQSALNMITGDISDEQKLKARRKEVVDRLKDTYSVKEEEILSAIGKASVNHITKDDLVTLIGIGQAIKDGDTTIDSVFRKKKEKNETVGLKELRQLYKSVESSLTEDERDAAKRILERKEKNSYKKLYKLLKQKKDDK